jgi:hypothetical protein
MRFGRIKVDIKAELRLCLLHLSNSKNKLCYPLPLKILISHAFSQLCFLFAANGWQTVALAVP